MEQSVESTSKKTFDDSFGTLRPYFPPAWLSKLKNIPKVKVELAMTPTRIHKWNLPGVPQNIEVCIKRDDMTGSALTGNKVRKLEFVFGHILQNGYKHVITCGGLQSNHCRATAVIAAQLGIKSHLLLLSESSDISSSNGNLFLSRMCDADLYLFPGHPDDEIGDAVRRQKILAEEIFQKSGETSYVLYPGGSDNIGLFGYLSAWEELMEQGVQDKFDDIVVAAGTGGTISGLAIGNYLTGQKVKIHGINVAQTEEFLYNHVSEMLTAMGLDTVKSEDIVDFIDGYIGEGYAKSMEEDHNLYKTIAATTGIFCDPIYVGKCVKGLIAELSTNPSRFKGERVLFIHTGGIFGFYDGRMFDNFSEVNVHDWKDFETAPWKN